VKLYWRVKRNGKWTWKAAEIYEPQNYKHNAKENYTLVYPLKEEEE